MSYQSLKIQKNWLTSRFPGLTTRYSLLATRSQFAPRSASPLCLFFFLVGLCFTVSCKDGARLPIESDQRAKLQDQVERGDVSVDGIVLTTNPEQTIYGRNIDFKITNQTDHPIAVAIQAGTVLRSENQQYYTNLVVSSNEQVLIAPKSLRIITVEVFSINFQKFSPVRSTKYSLGNLIEGDAKTFLDCFARRRPETGVSSSALSQPAPTPAQPGKVDLAPVQLVIWLLTDKMDRPALLKAVSNNPQLKGGQYSQSVKYYDTMAPFVQKLLDDCGLGKYKF
ncbi:MAG: hypothetical protein HY774_14425 [Acidobacteria bacterium]|nr:hypothetical protein [Acidobacteriota bacterium]